MCVKLTFISRLRNSIMANCSSFNTRDTGRTASVQRQTFCEGRKCGVSPDNAYIRLFQNTIDGNKSWVDTSREWLSMLFDWWSVRPIHQHKWRKQERHLQIERSLSSRFKQLTKSIQLGEDSRLSKECLATSTKHSNCVREADRSLSLPSDDDDLFDRNELVMNENWVYTASRAMSFRDQQLNES